MTAALAAQDGAQLKKLETPAEALKRHQAEIKSHADQALQSLAERMTALGLEAFELAEVQNVFPKATLDALRQFGNNTKTSADTIKKSLAQK